MNSLFTNSQLKTAFSEILRGYSSVKYLPIGDIYFKHLTSYDGADIDEVYSKHYNSAIENRLPTLKEKEEFILKEDLWSKEEEKKLLENKDLLERLNITKSKLFLIKQKEALEKQIEETDKTVKDLEYKKNELIGLTAEIFATRKINEYYLWYTAYKNRDLNERLFTENDFLDLSAIEINTLFKLHAQCLSKFNDDLLKYLALSGFFMNMFAICNDDPFAFYGKPVVNLTFFQIQLFEKAKMFKNIIINSENKIPDDVMNDPNKLIDWSESSRNVEKIIDKGKKGPNRGDSDFQASSVVGASKEDLKRLGLDNNTQDTNNLIELAKKKGGSLNIQDMISLHKA